MKLGDVAAVRSGLVLARKDAKKVSPWPYKALTLRSFNPEGYIDLSQLENYHATEMLNPDYLTQIGDVVIRLTAPYTAVLIDEQTEECVISSNFVVIRANNKKLVPEYLAWLLNTAKEKKAIYENTSSNMLGAIKAKYFLDYELADLPLADQRQIAELNLLARREARLLRELAEQKEKYYAHMIGSVQKKMRRGN